MARGGFMQGVFGIGVSKQWGVVRQWVVQRGVRQRSLKISVGVLYGTTNSHYDHLTSNATSCS